MSIIDTHCHYNLEPLFEDWKLHWTQAQEHGVLKSVVVGTNVTTSQRAVDLATAQTDLYAAIGVHPSEYQESLENGLPACTAETNVSNLASMSSHPKVVAVGETGLDYFRLPSETQLVSDIKAAQQAAFIQHIQLAEKMAVPLIIHVRDIGVTAYEDTLQILRDHHSLQQPFVLHCISGPLEYVQAALKLGAYIGVAGNVTYKNADHIRSLVRLTPHDRLLLETDAPFLPPTPHRGQLCEPKMIALTGQYLETELGVDPIRLLSNAKTIFQLS